MTPECARIAGSADPTGWRLPAKALERAVANVIANHLDERVTSHRLCTDLDLASVDAEVRMVTKV